MRGQILILTPEPITLPGGLEHAVSELSRALSTLGYAVSVISRRDVGVAWVGRPQGKWLTYLADGTLRWFLGKKVRDYGSAGLAAVISNGSFGPALNWLPGTVKKIHYYHGTYRGQGEAIKPLISALGCTKLKWWDSMVLERSSGRGKTIVCNSDQTRSEVERYFGYKGQTVWLPLDTKVFAPRDQSVCRSLLGLRDGERVALFVGSSSPTKGFPTIEELVKSYPEITWCLALRGSANSQIFGRHNVRVFPNANCHLLAGLYNAADVLLCPSLYESFGYVIAESLACGTPVVASKGGASGAFIQSSALRHLIIQDARSIEEFRAGVQDVLANGAEYRRYVLNEIRPNIIQRLSPENWIARFRTIADL